MGSSSVSLDELDKQDSQSASSVSLDELDAQSQPHDFTQEALSGQLAPAAGSPAKLPPETPAPPVAMPRGRGDMAHAAEGYFPPTDIPIQGVKDIHEGYQGFSGLPVPLTPVPAARGQMPRPVAPKPQVSPEQQEVLDQQANQRAKSAAKMIEGAGEVGSVALPGSIAAAPIATGVSIGAGILASKGAGAAVHGKVSPEAEELTRQVAFFVPSALGTVAGVKSAHVETPEGKFSAASAFGGKVRGGIARTPEGTIVRGQVGNVEVSFPPRRPAPIPEPSEAAKMLGDFERNTGHPDFQPAPPPPAPPGANGPEHLTPDVVKGVSDAIMQAPEAKRPGLMTEAHGNMVKWMVGRGTFVGPDGKIHTVDSEGQAKKLASKFINDEVDRRDAEAEKAATEGAHPEYDAMSRKNLPAAIEHAKTDKSRPVEGFLPLTDSEKQHLEETLGRPLQPGDERLLRRTYKTTIEAPIAGKPPAAGNMTTETAAVQKVAAEANIHPEQKPAIAVKKEAPKEAAALAKPPEPVTAQDVAKIGKEDKESGRTILQPSDDVIQNERLASAAAPELATKLSHIAAGVEGATFDRLRPQKELERVDEKVDDAGKPPETVPDYLAAQIAADTPQAKDQLIAQLHKHFPVVKVEDNFLEGKPELANYRSANVQVGLGNGSTAEVQIVPRELQEIANESHVFYTAGREAGLRGDKAEQEKQFAQAAEMHDAAMEKFNKRNGIEPKPKHEFSSTQINIDPQSDLGKAHAKAVAAIPEEHVGKEGLEKTPHVTIRYGLKEDSPASIEKIRQAAAEIEPFDVPIGKTDVFPATEHSSFDHPVIARLETTPELKALRKAVEGAGAFKEDNFPEYKPHITLGYIKPEFAQQYKGGNQLEGQKVPVKEITVSKRDGSQESIPLGGQQPHSVPLDELEAIPQPERRTNVAERKRVEHLTPEERAHELLTSELTGLPNKRAFAEDAATMAESHPHVGYADIDDFKQFNSILGHEGVDEKVLPEIGEVFRRAAAKEPGGSVKVYHRSGDEFLFRSKDEAAIGRVVDRVNKDLENARFTAESPDGKIHEKQGAGLSYGTGKDAKSAESAADLDKQRRKEAGLRSGARDLPGPVGEKSAGGVEADRVPERIEDQGRTSEGQAEALPEQVRSVPIEELEKSSPDTSRVGQLIDRFTNALSAGTMPTDPREIRAMAKEELGGDPAKYIDEIYDAIEGATNRYMRERRPDGLLKRIEYAATIEEKIGKRTRTLEITKLQQFSTPHTISEAAAYAAGAGPSDTVLEPTAGTGNLVEPLLSDAGEVLVNEIDPRRAEVLKANEYRHITQEDYLKSNLKADVIVTNPPWGKIGSGKYKALDVPAPWGRFNDVSERFVVKNLRDLPDGGRLVAVLPTTIMQPGSRGFRRWLEENGTLQAIIQSPPGAYEHRGTSVDSLLVVVDKGKVPTLGTILRVESKQPKDWAEYAEAVRPLADGGKYARAKGTSREAGEAAERAPLGDRTPVEPESSTAGTDSGRGLPELRGPGASPEPVRSERSGMGADMVPERDVSQSVDSPGADGEAQPAATPRLVRQGARALRPKNVSAARLKEFDEASDSPVFTPYVLRSGISGNPHPRQIVETRSLAGASAPEISYKPSKGVIDAHSRKVISDEQVDTVAAIGQAIENGHAYMVADDVGLGKSRELGATAIDWLEKGKAKRLLVTSKGEVNLRDLESELKIVAGTDSLPFKYVYLRDYKEAAERAQSKNPYNPVPGTDNTIYVVESFNLTPYRRAIQDLKIDGVLGDEVHTYKNEDAGVGQTWKVLHADWLQRKVPIAYFTATPGTTLDDLEYLYGLREWKLDGFSDWVARKTGHGTGEAQKKRGQTPDQPQDISAQVGSDATEVSKSGRVTKAAQALASARLSGDRQLIAHFEAELKQAQKDEKNKKWGQNKGDSFHVTVSTAEMEQIMRELKMKGKYGARDLWRAGVEFGEKEAPLTKPESEGYRRAVSYMREVEKAFNAFANENEAMRKGFGVTAHLQAAAKRRLFDMRLKRGIAEAKESLARGEQPVISLINVNPTVVGEGYMAAALNQINVNKVIVDKESGEVTDLGEIPEAVAVKNELIERGEEEFPPSPDPIAMIQKEFGKDKVAVITGNESPKVRRQMMEDFQKGIKKVAVISGAGKTGISLHHVIETAGGAKGRRHLILADYEWSATNFKQELGRVDRSGQASPPKITALTLGSAAEKKFISTIANRMKTLGAVSKGAAESTGTGALEHFELGGDIDNQVVREMWRIMPLNLREQFRGRHFMNYDQDGVARPKSSIENVGVRDFLLQLQLIPVEEGNKIWDHFWKHREETYSGDAVAAREAQKTGKTKGEILRSHALGPDLDLYEVKDAAGHRAGILSGMVTEHMGALQQHLDSGEEKTAEGMTVIRKRREYTTFTGSKGEQISGLRLRPGQVEPIAKAFGKGIAYEHTPETALQDVVAGDKVPLDNGWTLYMGKGGEKKGYVIIDGAKLSNTNRGQDVLRHGAKYNAVSGGFFYLPEDKATVQGFLERFPIKKQAVENKKATAAKATPPTTTGFQPGSMRASVFGVDILAKQAGEFYKQDVAPAVKGAAGGLKEVVTKGLRLVAPRVGVPSHLLDTIMKMKGQREEEMYRFQRTTEGMKKMFDKLPEEARIAFIDRMMHGQRQPSTELEDVADSIRAIQDRFRDQERIYAAKDENGKPRLTDKENYFHLKWDPNHLPKGVDEDGNLIEDSGGSGSFTGQGNRPLQGGRSFMKRKTLPDASAGISRGGELLTTNPIGLLEHRVQESLKFTTARKMWEELKDTPYTVSEKGRPMHMVQFFREGQGQQARALGYEQLNDRIAKVLFPAGSGEGMVHPGEYWVEQNAARLLNNFLSRDLIREYAVGRGIIGAKNASTAWRLAFSPFHMLVESIITTGSEIGRGIEHSFNQGVRQGSAGEIGKGAWTSTKSIVAPSTAAREGGSAIRYVTNPQEFLATTRGQKFIKRYPEAAELISDLFTGGAKLAMHEDYRMKMVESMRRAVADNNYIGAVLRTPGALSQAIQYPLFETYIPRLKLGMFLREYSEALADREPEIEAGKLTRAKLARETWDNIDYRFGEVNWDNFFFNRTFKTSLQLAFRAFAWRFGNFAFTGSAVTGQGRQVAESLKFLKDAATGGESARPGTNAIPKLDPRMAKLLGLAIFGLIAHGMLQWALTREKPKDVKDLIAPRDGTLDAHGHPNRWTLPIVPYRDLESAKANPMGYLRGGTADIWTAIPEAINNRDFRNHLISHPSDPYWEQMFDKAAHVVGTPIGFDRYRQEKKRGEGTGNALLGEAGLSRATNYELTPAEKKMREIQIAHYGPETDEDLEAREKKEERIAAGHLTLKEMQDKIRNSTKNNFERGMKSFTYEQAKQVYDVATPEEKAMIGMMLLRKRFNSRRAAASGQ